MDGMGNPFFADSALTKNKDRCVRSAHLFHERVDIPHDLRVTDNRFRPVSILQLVLKTLGFLP